MGQRTVKVLYPNVLEVHVGCLSHTIENAGRFCTPVLDKFIRSWLTLFTHSPEA